MTMLRKSLMLLSLSAAIVAMVSSCSLYHDYEARQPANVMETEALLEQAAFRRVPISTPDQRGAAKDLPLHQLNRYQSAEGSVFWYADPDICGCLYEGDQRAYEQYLALLQQRDDTAKYINEADQDQLAMLTPFGESFPPPLIWGAWPVFVVPVVRGPYGPPRVRPGPRPIGHPHGGGRR